MARPPSRLSRFLERPSMRGFRETTPGELFIDLLTFDRLMTGPVVHLIYWAGLALLVLGGFSVVGGAVGIALREEGVWGWLLALPMLVSGLLVLGAGVLLWRSFCEFYVAIFRISDDLRAMRKAAEAETAASAPAPAQPSERQDPPAHMSFRSDHRL